MFTPTKLVVLLASVLSVAAWGGEGYIHSPGLGACGIVNNDDQDVVAVSRAFFDSDHGLGPGGDVNPLCNRTATVAYEDKTISVQITDVCETCAFGDLSFSPHAFSQLADLSVGHITHVAWAIVYD